MSLVEKVRQQFNEKEFRIVDEGGSVLVAHLLGMMTLRVTEVDGRLVTEFASATPQKRMENQREMDAAMGTKRGQ